MSGAIGRAGFRICVIFWRLQKCDEGWDCMDTQRVPGVWQSMAATTQGAIGTQTMVTKLAPQRSRCLQLNIDTPAGSSASLPMPQQSPQQHGPQSAPGSWTHVAPQSTPLEYPMATPLGSTQIVRDLHVPLAPRRQPHACPARLARQQDRPRARYVSLASLQAHRATLHAPFAQAATCVSLDRARRSRAPAARMRIRASWRR